MPDAFVTFISPFLYIGLVIFYTCFFIKRNTYLKPAVKIIPHILVVCSVMYIFATTSPPYPVISPYYLLKLNRLLYTYLFVVIADVLYTFQNLFFYGVIYSCLAQWNLAYMFSEGESMFVGLSYGEICSLGLIFGIMISFYLYIACYARWCLQS